MCLRLAPCSIMEATYAACHADSMARGDWLNTAASSPPSTEQMRSFKAASVAEVLSPWAKSSISLWKTLRFDGNALARIHADTLIPAACAWRTISALREGLIRIWS